MPFLRFLLSPSFAGLAWKSSSFGGTGVPPNWIGDLNGGLLTFATDDGNIMFAALLSTYLCGGDIVAASP